MMNKSSILKLFLALFSSLIISLNSYAGFGENCADLSSEYFSDNLTTQESQNPTMISFVKSLIDIKNCSDDYNDGCKDISESKMAICVRKSINGDIQANSDNSNKFEISNGQTFLLGDIAESIEAVQADPNIANIKLTLGPIGNKLCLVIPSPNGYFPIFCKDNPATPSKLITDIFDDMSDCSEYSDGCNLFSTDNPSRTPNNFFGAAVQCVYESLDFIFFDLRTCDQRHISKDDIHSYNHNIKNATKCNEWSDGFNCTGNNFNADLNKFARETKVKPFSEFYSSMQLIVSAMITMYVIFFGFWVVLNPGEVSINDGFLAVVKILMVIYFSVGSTGVNWFTGKSYNNNGVTQLLLPFMVSFTETMSSFVFNNSGNNNLCYFEPNEYKPGYSYYSIWDSIDCRLNIITGTSKIFRTDSDIRNNLTAIDIPPDSIPIGYVLSSALPDTLKSMTPAQKAQFAEQVRSNAAVNLSNVSDDGIVRAANEAADSPVAMSIVYFLTCMFLGGGVIQCILIGLIIVMLSGLFISIFMSYIVCIMLLYILAYIAPIFVPMYLFERTRGYFNGWFNLVLSTTLQPVIILGFGAYVLTLLDSVLFEDCKFGKYLHNSYDKVVFVAREPTNPEHKDNCEKSFGYSLLKSFQYPNGWREVSLLLFKINTMSDVWGLEGSMWTCVIMFIFLRFLLDQVYDLSASVTGGLNIKSAVMEPTAFLTIMKKTYDNYRSLKKQMEESGKGKAEAKESGQDSVGGK